MRNVLIICIACFIPATFTSQPTWAADDWTGNVNFTLGAKSLDKDDWAPVEDQGELGINVDFRKQA